MDTAHAWVCVKPLEGEQKGLIQKVAVTELSQSIDATGARQSRVRTGPRFGVHHMGVDYVSRPYRSRWHGILQCLQKNRVNKSIVCNLKEFPEKIELARMVGYITLSRMLKPELNHLSGSWFKW